MSKVLVITTSLRAKSNSNILAERLIAGARDAGHEVETISLKGKKSVSASAVFPARKRKSALLKTMQSKLPRRSRMPTRSFSSRRSTITKCPDR